ncbi:hypothetical protein ASG22_09650 [Chryseobacterium sp. Leaf405]|uniref:hypothetical protein n=1 Tax=Chryseobacterium sp. Leaf405 TaxID=1736367 RepID=UPI0006F79A4D|nr:hypothetical protein [Chryseobacterium sp. Leaf405]KQT24267.1 hypothetical protein ASG22_09650 [Chryseobacterium sp. Leaf405]
MKLFQIITIIFCLGIFLIPKDDFYAQNKKEDCCKSNSEMSCCKNNHKEHSKDNHKEQKSSCTDDCCSTCATCYTFIETPFSKSLQLEYSYYKSNKNLQFEYSDPHISDRLKEIWQPPKIA